LLEVVERLAASPAATAELARTVDWRIAEVALTQPIGPLPASTAAVIGGEADRLLRIIGAFLAGQTKLPGQLMEGILTPHNGAAPAVGGLRARASPAESAEARAEQEAASHAPDGGPKHPAADPQTGDPKALFEDGEPPAEVADKPTG